MKKVDLAELDTVAACDKGSEVELRHPATGAPLGVFFTVVGKDSNAFRDHIRESINDRLRHESLAKKRGRDLEIPTLEKSEEDNINLLTVCTKGWRTGEEQLLVIGGQGLPFNVQNALKVYRTYPWIRRQIDEAIGDLENFMKV